MNGTLNMTTQDTKNKRKLSSQGICDIIIACKNAGVKVLRYQGLELYFDGHEESPSLEINQNELKTLSERTELETRANEVEMDLDLLALENPLRYEEYMNSEDAMEGDSEGYRTTQ